MQYTLYLENGKASGSYATLAMAMRAQNALFPWLQYGSYIQQI